MRVMKSKLKSRQSETDEGKILDTQKMASSKKTQHKNRNQSSSPSKMSVKVIFTPLEKLQGKTQAKLYKILPLTVAMLPDVAAKRGFIGPFITLSTEKDVFPALLVLDKRLKEDVSIVAQSVAPYQNLSEGDNITISSSCYKLFAEEVSFCHVSHKQLIGSVPFTQYLKEQLISNGLIICTRMKIIVQYLSQQVTLKVQNVKFFAAQATQYPQTPFQCIWQTQISTESAMESLTKIIDCEIKFKDIGGYQTQIQDLQNQIDMLFSPINSNVKPVKGILISGSSGCGKSIIGEALRTKFGNKCVSILLEDVKSKYRGETEQNLKKVFTKAASRAPCLLFIDDIDILCSSRDRKGNTGIVTALLHLMDGLASSVEGIMVIATASKPQSLDSALRRPGRLSYDLFLPPPDEFARENILQKMLTGVPNDLDVSDMKTLATNTHSYVGGDLRSVVMESVMQTEGRRLTKEDLAASLTVIKPAALRDSSISKVEIKLSDICGYERIKYRLQEAMNLTLAHGSVFQRCGISPPTRFLIYGPPGCGKSSIIMALANEFHLSVISVKRSTVLGKYFGESEQNIAKVFLQASNSSPCILHFENFEGLAGKKPGEDGGTDLENRIINHLKVQLDGITRNDGVFIFAETNRPDLLNKDVIRQGRFNAYHLVDLPGPEDRQLILRKYFPPCTLSQEVPFDTLVNLTRSLTVAEILHFLEEIKIQSKQEHKLKLSDSVPIVISGNSNKEIPESVIVPSTSHKMLQKYQTFANTYCSIEI